MWIYFVVIICCFILHYVYNSVDSGSKDIVRNTFIVLLALFLCFGYMAGTDWRMYEVKYNELSITNWMKDIYEEPGYRVYAYIFRMLNVDFWHFFIFTKIITYLIFIRVIRKYCPDACFFLALMFFVALYSFFLWIDNPLRNLIAISIALYSIPALLERNKWKYFLIILIATAFHYSSLIMVPFYWILNKQYKNSTVVFVFILFNLAFIDAKILYSLADFLVGWIPAVAYRLHIYSTGIDSAGITGKAFSFGYALHLMIFILILIFRKRIESLQYGNFLFNVSIVYICLFRMGLTVAVFSRLSLFCAVFYSITVASIMQGFEMRSRRIYTIFLLIACLFAGYSSLTVDSRYVPYSNYLEYVGKDKPTFKERAKYNNEHSPYPPPKR